MIDAIVMKIGLPAATPSRNSLREHADYRIKVVPLEIAIGIGPFHHVEQILFLPFLRGGRRNNLLRQNVQRCCRNLDSVKIP